MNIDEKLNKMEPKDTPLLVLGYIFLGMMLLLGLPANAQDNEVYINQSGNNVDLTILQAGYDNTINFSIGGTNNVVDLLQQGNGGYIGYTSAWGSGLAWGGDLDGDYNNLNIVQTCNQGSSCAGDRFEFHIQGDSNDVDFYQGYHVTSSGTVLAIDDYEYGGHFTQLDIHGSNNTFLGSQRSNNSGHEHTNYSYIYGDYNNVYTRQEGNQDKTLNLTLYNSYNDVDMVQKGSATHNATVTLSGSYSTTLYMLQQGGTAQSYTLSQTCATVGGCSVSVTQGQ